MTWAETSCDHRCTRKVESSVYNQHIRNIMCLCLAGIIIAWFMFTCDDSAYTSVQLSIHTSRGDLELRIVFVYFMLTSVEGD